MHITRPTRSALDTRLRALAAGCAIGLTLLMLPGLSLVSVAPPAPSLTLVPPSQGGNYPDFMFVPDALNSTTMTLDLGLAQPGVWNAPAAGLSMIYDASEWVVAIYYESFILPIGKTLKFTNHPSRCPVAIFVHGSATVAGTLNLRGLDSDMDPGGTSQERFAHRASPGPGGFHGGLGRSSTSGGGQQQGSGFGPGGGTLTSIQGLGYTNGAGGGHRLSGGPAVPSPAGIPGARYGSPRVEQLVGGSGGAGDPSGFQSADGGAGGGAILLVANMSITITGTIDCRGGAGGYSFIYYGEGGAGSSGSMRLISESIAVSGSLFAPNGWIRLEFNQNGGLGGGVPVFASIDVGQADNAVLFAGTAAPSVRIVSIGGSTLPSDPRAGMSNFELPDAHAAGSGAAVVIIEGTNVPITAQVFLRVTRARGVSTGEVSVSGAPTGNDQSWTRSVVIDFTQGYTALQVRAVLE